MANPIYEIKDKPEYQREIPAITTQTPAHAETVLRPLFESVINNTEYVRQRTEEVAGELDEAIEGLTPEGIGAIPTTEKAKAGGVATLDNGGKVPAGQLPAMNYDPAGSAAAVKSSLDSHTAAANPHSGSVPTSRKINGKALTGDVTLSAGDVGAISGAMNPIQIGGDSLATGACSTAIGYNAHALDNYSTAIGCYSNASGNDSTALGYGAKATGTSGTAIGKSAKATGNNSIAVGMYANASQINSTALGYSATASGQVSLALGLFTRALADHSTSVGHNAKATETGATTTGAYANALARFSTSIGYNAYSNGTRSAAFASYANAIGSYSLALGSNAASSGNYSTALGYQSITAITDTNTIQLGNATNLAVLRSSKALSVVSDIRDKTDIEPIDGALDFIRAVEPIRYVDNGREAYHLDEVDEATEELRGKYGLAGYDREAHTRGDRKGERRRIGVSAQQVEETLQRLYGTDNYADLVSDNLHDIVAGGETLPEGVESKKTVAYSNFVPFLIGAVQELAQHYDKLADRVELLEGRDDG